MPAVDAASVDCEAAIAGFGGHCADTLLAAWTRSGADLNGNYTGDGGPALRATPAERQFAIVHRGEGAWSYSPRVFELWGMGTSQQFFDTDSGTEIPDGTQLFSTGLPPRGTCSEHQSLGSDACQPREPQTGEPAMQPVWRFIMGAPYPGEPAWFEPAP
ncbi:MAG: hypothetical protein ACI81R_003391 [Bradymonadia bacterium]